MFRKLISSLPFSPSLIYELAAYSKHLKFESHIRTAGLLLSSVAVGLQLAGLLLIPYPSASSSAPAESQKQVLGASVETAADGDALFSSASRPVSTMAPPPKSRWQPNIDPAYGLLLSVSFLLIAAFFNMRDRLLSKEIDLVKADFTSGGGV